MTNDKLTQLRERMGEMFDVGSALALLEWDMEVMMPPQAAEARGRHLATLSGLRHRLATAPEFGRLLHELREAHDLGEDDRRLVAEALYDYERATRLPEAFVKELAEAQARGYNAWIEARRQSDFAMFRPHLEKIVELERRAADYYGFEGSPYNALLETYERGMRAEKLRPLFAELAERQSTLLHRIMASGNRPDLSWLDGAWSVDAQQSLSLRVLNDMGFELEAGRLDTAPHPFCTTFALRDVRLTTRYHPDQAFSALFTAMHEGGHGLYEQGFDPAYEGTPLSLAPSLGIHECNSRLWENIVGRSRAFWRHYLPVAREYFPEQLRDVTVDMIYPAVNRVEPTLIRVEADECTYNLHVIARFELEIDLIEGRLAVKDLPEAWNAKYKHYLGIDVPNDAQGCLQDVHWSHGLFGYFPTYTLGNLYSAQVYEVVEKEIPDIQDRIEAGHLRVLREWLRERIHLVGRRKTAPEIVQAISGREPESAPYLRYLETKFGELYGV